MCIRDRSQGGYVYGNTVETAYWQGTFKDAAIGWEKTSLGGLVVPPPRPPNVGPGIPNFLIRLPSGPYQPPLGPAVQPNAIAF